MSLHHLPSGGYIPVFHYASQPTPELPPLTPDSVEQPVPPQRGKPANRWTSRWVVATAALLLIGFIVVLIGTQSLRKSTPEPTPQQFQPVDLSTAANLSEVRISAGASTAFVDAQGHTWVADRYFKGGAASSDPKLEVSGTLRPQIYRVWRQGDFSYRIPLKPGVYELTLDFCEPSFRNNSDGSRTFDVFINGVHTLQEFDILTEAGAGQIVTVRTWKDIRPGEDGFLTIDFKPLNNAAVVSGISVIAGTAGRLRPIRIATREEPYTDSIGRLWSPDRHFSGGKLVKRIEAIHDPRTRAYRGERYTPLTPSPYRPTPPTPPSSTSPSSVGGTGAGAANSRLFDILCNGLMLQQNFDVHKEAGGPFLAIRKTYRGLKPTPNGKLVFQFVPSKNYAFVNAIEILDETPATTPAAKR